MYLFLGVVLFTFTTLQAPIGPLGTKTEGHKQVVSGYCRTDPRERVNISLNIIYLEKDLLNSPKIEE